MDVLPGMNVVNQRPTGMIRIIVDGKVVTTSQAPVLRYWPVPFRYLEIESAWKPELAKFGIKSNYAVSIFRAEALKVSVWRRLRGPSGIQLISFMYVADVNRLSGIQ